MFMIKMIGCLIILISSTLIGLEYSKKYTERLNNLIHIQNCIQILETEIVYASNPIPIALKNIYTKGNEKVSFLFEEIREYLLSNTNSNLYDSFSYILEKNKDAIFLDNEDIEVIISLARVLGTSDRIDQQKHFKTALTNIDMKQKDAHMNKIKNGKMYKSLGLLFGFALILILY